MTRVPVDAVKIVAEDIKGWLVANEGSLTVALDIDITPELAAEGLARELVNRIQNLRKQYGLQITDHISLAIEGNEQVRSTVEGYADYIGGQVLADAIVSRIPETAERTETLDIDGTEVRIAISQA